MNGFTSVRNSFIADARFTATEKILLIWLASKPADWQVRNEQIEKELGIGRDATKRMLHSLRNKGAVTRPSAGHGANGQWVKSPSYLAIRDEIRQVSAGQTGGLKSAHGVTCNDGENAEFQPVSPKAGSPAYGSPASGFPAYTNKESTTKEGSTKEDRTKENDQADDMETLSKAATRQAVDDGESPPFMPEWTDELTERAKAHKAKLASPSQWEPGELRRLVCNAPDAHTLEVVWKMANQHSEWTDELTELAKARKAHLASLA